MAFRIKSKNRLKHKKHPARGKLKKQGEAATIEISPDGTPQPAEKPAKISSAGRLEELLAETEQELESIQPQIEALEKQLDQLKILKLAKQKLITLKLSIQSILSNFSEKSKASEASLFPSLESEKLSFGFNQEDLTKSLKVKDFTLPVQVPSTSSGSRVTRPAGLKHAGRHFVPEAAFQAVDAILKQKSSINYDLFRAVVYNGGRASTEQIKAYLLEHDVRQPASGESFAHVPLTDISSRINYLVRKGVVESEGRGRFCACLGWQAPD